MVVGYSHPRRRHAAEPVQGDGVQRITFTMRLAGLDPNNLPLDRIYEILFTVPSNPDTTFFVGMSTCDRSR